MDASLSDSSIHLAKQKATLIFFSSYITLLAVGLFDTLKDFSYLQKHQPDRIHVSFIFIRTKNDFLLGEGGGHENVCQFDDLFEFCSCLGFGEYSVTANFL